MSGTADTWAATDGSVFTDCGSAIKYEASLMEKNKEEI